jgi:hypothetical protein
MQRSWYCIFFSFCVSAISLGCTESESTQQSGRSGELLATENEGLQDTSNYENGNDIVSEQGKLCVEELIMGSTISSEEKEALREKIDDDVLQSSVMTSTDETVSVIIELKLPQRKVEFEPSNLGNKKFLRPKSVSTTEEMDADERETVSEARKYISRLVGYDPTYLKAARAFVVELSGSQICSVAKQAFTKMIEPNRRR